jgi:hypothetical protein
MVVAKAQSLRFGDGLANFNHAKTKIYTAEMLPM